MTIAQSHAKLLPIFVAGCAVIAGEIVIGALAMALAPSPEWVVGAIAGGFLMGVPLGIRVTRSLPALTFPTMGLFALTYLVPAFVVDVPLWGGVVELHAADAIPTGAGTAGYVAPGWRIDAGRSLQERLTAGRGRGYGYRHVAPLIGPGWKPDQPVRLWVAGETRDSGRVLLWHPQFWADSGGEFVLLVGKQVSGAQITAKHAAEKFGLLIDAEPIVVMRVPSVAQALSEQHWALARAARYPFIAWVLFMGIAAAIMEWRRRRVLSGGLGRR